MQPLKNLIKNIAWFVVTIHFSTNKNNLENLSKF